MLIEMNKKIDPDETICFLLSDSTLKISDPIHRYNYYPGKHLLASNHFKYFDLNYPYYVYKKNTSTTAFSPANHLRFFAKAKMKDDESFDKLQLSFVKRNKIKWLICEKNVTVPSLIIPLIYRMDVDYISGEKLYQLR
jgi:hypothetical protein